MNRRQKGTGSVWQDKNKPRVWHGEIQIGTYPNGKPKKKRVSGNSAKEVKNKLEQIKYVQLNEKSQKSALTIPQIAQQLADEKYKLNVIKDTTYNRLNAEIKILNDSFLSQVPICDITEDLVRDFLASQTHYSNSALRKIYRQISAAMRKAVKMGLIQNNLCDDIPCPKSDKPTKKVTALTTEEQAALINAVNADNKEPYRTMILTSMFTGARMGELCALSLADYDAHNKKLKIDKTITRDRNDRFVIGDTTKTEAGTRTISLTATVCKLFDEYIENIYTTNKYNALFLRNDKLVTTAEVNLYYKRLIERYKIAESADGYNQHQLRHTYATRCIESGMNAKVLQHKLGHHDIRITLNTYADVFAQFEDSEDDKFMNYMTKKGIAV